MRKNWLPDVVAMLTDDLPPISVTALVTAVQVMGSARLEVDSKAIAVAEVDQEISTPSGVPAMERDGGGLSTVATDQVIWSLAAEGCQSS